MARTAGRSAEETRREILDAALRLIGKHGTAVPVTDIARAAGVSKGGLLYHFPSKDELLHGLLTEMIKRFRADVADAIVEGDDAAGRLTRAYIRASFSDTTDVGGMRDLIAVAAQFMFEPELQELLRIDGEYWRTELHADGLAPSVIRMVVAATDGSSSAPLWGPILDEADQRELQEQLIAMTYQQAD